MFHPWLIWPQDPSKARYDPDTVGFWTNRAAKPRGIRLEALMHRSRVTEATALADPEGLGAFRVLQWNVGG